MNASDSILIDRTKVNAMLHLSRNASYRMLARSRFKGKVRMADVRGLLEKVARNGAVWDGGDMVLLDGANFGISQRSLFRALKRAPHFRISRKIALVEVEKLEDFLKRKCLNSGCGRASVTLLRAAHAPRPTGELGHSGDGNQRLRQFP